MTIVAWPDALKRASISFNPRGQVVTGPRTLTGRSNVNAVDAGYWTARLALATLPEGAAIRAARAFRAKLQGGAHQALVPVTDSGQAPWPTPGVTSQAVSDFTDDTQFSDGAGFFEPLIRIALSADAALRAARVSVTVTAAGTISGGEYFSVDGRLHVIRDVVSVSGSAQTWDIWPPLRGPLSSGRDLNFDRPVCLMRLTEEAAFDLPIGPYYFHGAAELAFEEVIGA